MALGVIVRVVLGHFEWLVGLVIVRSEFWLLADTELALEVE